MLQRPATILEVQLHRALLVLAFVFLEMEHFKEGLRNALLCVIWSDNDSKEWKPLAVEAALLALMRLKVQHRWVNLKDRMAVIPSKLDDAIFVHLLLYFDLLVIGDLAILESHRWSLDAGLRRIDLADDQIPDGLVGTLDAHIAIIGLATKQANDFVLGEVGVDVHQHLYLKGEVDPVWLGLE